MLIFLIPKLKLRLFSFIGEAPGKTGELLYVDVVAIAQRLAELDQQLVGVKKIGHDADEQDPSLLLPQEQSRLQLAGFPPELCLDPRAAV